MTKEEAKQAIEQAEYNCSGLCINYSIDKMIELSAEGVYLIFAVSKD